MAFQSCSTKSGSPVDQGQGRGSGVGHVSGGIKPILEEEEQAEGEGSRLATAEEISGKEQGHKPLQNGSSPKAEGPAKPSEEQVSSFVSYIHAKRKDD